MNSIWLREISATLPKKGRGLSKIHLQSFIACSDQLANDFEEFKEAGKLKSETFEYWDMYKHIKITIKENQIDMDVLLIPEVDNVQRPCLSLKSGFSISLLVCEFYPHRQTWYQKCAGTYPLLPGLGHSAKKPFV